MLFGLVAQTHLAGAQTLSGLKIGDDTAAAIKALGEPAKKNQTITSNQLIWTLPNGNELTASADGAGKIVFLENAWGQKPGSEATGLYDFAFGKTTLAEVRTKLGSGGMSYTKRPPMLSLPEGIVLVNSFEVGPLVYTFYGVVRSEDMAKGREQAASGGFALFAKLDSVSITSPAFAQAQWGEPMYPTGYKKSTMK